MSPAYRCFGDGDCHPMPLQESALVVLVPDAESLVRPLREKYDPSATKGMPAHVTLLYPFVPPDEIGPSVFADLRRCFRRFSPFRFALVELRRFPGVLYLAPEPDEPFRRLTTAIWRGYPDYPPYGGQHPDILPHLSLAALEDERKIDAVAEEFMRASVGKLPVRATACEIALMDDRSGCWQNRCTFRLGGEEG